MKNDFLKPLTNNNEHSTTVVACDCLTNAKRGSLNAVLSGNILEQNIVIGKGMKVLGVSGTKFIFSDKEQPIRSKILFSFWSVDQR